MAPTHYSGFDRTPLSGFDRTTTRNWLKNVRNAPPLDGALRFGRLCASGKPHCALAGRPAMVKILA